MKKKIFVKRIYLPAAGEDGYRVLVDRLWPRGLTREKANFDWWGKEMAPSTELREWYHKSPDQRDEFTEKYLKELSENTHKNEWAAHLSPHGVITLLYAVKDPSHTHATILRDFLEKLLN